MSQPDPIQTPDDKDWTWVLTRKCADCGLNPAELSVAQVADMARSQQTSWAQLLDNPFARQRPSSQVWSGLEYAAHVADVFDLAILRTELMLDEHDPTFANWDQDQTAVEKAYFTLHASDVIEDIGLHSSHYADLLSAIPIELLSRTGKRSDGARFSIESFAKYLIHDPMHHLDDVARGYEALSKAN